MRSRWMGAEEDLLLRVAQDVTDGESVDWDGAMKAHPDLENSLRGLQMMESIAEVHRTPPTGPLPAEVASPSDLSSEETRPTPPDSEVTTESLPHRWGPLTILERLGRGGFGEVYRAHDPSLQRDVALKLMSPERCGSRQEEDRFIREARRLARVKHDNVVVVHGADRHDGRVGIWMDLIEGDTLETCLRRQGQWRAEQAALDGIDLCRALAAVHHKGLVHRDVKTGNVMRRKEDGRLILMDFGACAEIRTLRDAAGRQPISGTPLFMGPEVYRGEEPGVAADIYALGVVLYRLVSGRFPVEGRTKEEVQEKHLRGESTPLEEVRDDLPEAFVDVVQQAIDPDPKKRFRSVGEMRMALRRIIEPRERKPSQVVVYVLAVVAASLVVTVGSLSLWRYFFPPFEVDAALYRLGTAVEERLTSGAEVRPGDQLFLKIRGSREMHVYVLNRDARGVEFVMFPLRDSQIGVPLPARTTHHLPSEIDGVPQYWRVNSAGGQETIAVFASNKPMPDLVDSIRESARSQQRGEPSETSAEDSNRQIADLRQPGDSADDSDLQRDARDVVDRGIGEVGPEQRSGGQDSSDQRLARVIEKFTRRAESDPGVHAWKILLENPGE